MGGKSTVGEPIREAARKAAAELGTGAIWPQALWQKIADFTLATVFTDGKNDYSVNSSAG